MHLIKVTSNMSELNTHISMPENIARNKMAVWPGSQAKKNKHSCIKHFLNMKLEVSITLSYEKRPIKGNKLQLLN